MACAACGQRRIGFSASTAHVLGADSPMQPIYALIKQSGLLPNVRVGEYRWVTGMGVAKAIDDELIQESGVRPKPTHLAPSEVWCVKTSGTERCFRTIEQARKYAQKNNSPIEHRLLGA